MKLGKLLADRKAELLERWFERVIAAYPEETARFLQRKRDRFENPIGATIRESLDQCIDGLTAERPADELASTLFPLIKILAVQEFPPSRALRFLFLLKDLARELLADQAAEEELARFGHTMDELSLVAFDLYARSREQVFQLRINDVKRSTSGLVAMLNKRGFLAEPEVDQDGPAVCASRLQRGVDS